jgi:TolB-like protein
MDTPVAHVVYEFGDFRLDASRRLLFGNGHSRHLGVAPQALEALVYLVEHAGEFLGKERLLAALWPGAVVEENSLNRVISNLRHVLGESPGDHRYIATVPGRGYRFVADVVRTVQGPVFTLPDKSLAVLPFDNLGERAGDELVARGIAEALRHRLAAIRGLLLAAQTPSFAPRRREADASGIGDRLNARYLVEGSVQRAGGRLRVTAQLIDAAVGLHVWSLRFDFTNEDIFAVEDAIAQSVARAIEASLFARSSPPEP